ncbi:MAG: hypothetical protein JO093_13705 [Acidobacteria bacterium]|nr:hypothetical protein [Acidobacteriota bacterium]MBV9068521.1 hypothetical protein [Acidobacteriota bacterium]MBV9186669.1 hypothetical protein [Acidobacteriota bacterium]
MFDHFDRNDLERRAREDARLNIYEPDAYVLATLGPEPAFDPVGNLRHANVGSRLQDPRIEEGEADIRRVEENLARHPNAHFLFVFLLLLLFVESAGAIYVMRAIGVESPERIVFGTALATCIFFTAWLLSRARNRLVSVAALLSLGLLMGALTLVRVGENAGDGGSRTVDWAMGIIMTAVTVGPALLAEHVLRLLSPVQPLVRRRLQLSRRLTAARFQKRNATWFVNRVADRRQRWQRTAERMRAAYDIAHRTARVELGDSPFPANGSTTLVRLNDSPQPEDNQ